MADTRLEELRRRVELNPASPAFAALAEEYRKVGQFDEAIATARTGLERFPTYLSARVTLGRSLIEINELEEARTHLEGVVSEAPENLAAIRALADIHRRLEEPTEDTEVDVLAAALDERVGGDESPAAEPAPEALDLAPEALDDDPRVLAGLQRFLDAVVAQRAGRRKPPMD